MKEEKPRKKKDTKSIEERTATYPQVTARSAAEIGNTVRRIRRLQELTQIDLSKKSGVTQATISRIEAGATKTEVGTLFLLLSALGADLIIAPRK